MKAIFDKYKYILGLGLALVAVVMIAVISAAMGKDAQFIGNFPIRFRF